MVTHTQGIEVTGLPLMYPYWNGPSTDTKTRVIDTENHYYSQKNSNPVIDSVNMAGFPIHFGFTDIPNDSPDPTSGNCVSYNFTPSSGTSEEPGVGPIVGPGSGVGPTTT